MKVLVAPSAFKGSLSAFQAGQIIRRGLIKSAPGITADLQPLTDGGEGFALIITKTLGGRVYKAKVTGPTGRTVSASYGIVREPGRKGKTAVIEMAQACGLSMVPVEKRDPLRTTTLGVGELYKNALDRGCDKIVVGVGDSATIDCGMGALHELGVKFLDESDDPVPLTAAGLNKLSRIDISKLDPRASKARWLVCCDVDNRLTGPNGALMFAPQKGAGRKMMGEIGRGLMNFRRIILGQTGLDVDKIPGSGAAGGLPAGMAAVLKARFVSGFDLLRKVSGLDKKLKECDLVITGEGRFDEQSMRGKAVYRLIELARQYRKPVICICGSFSRDARTGSFGNFVKFLSLRKPGMSVEESIARSEKLLESEAYSTGLKIRCSTT